MIKEHERSLFDYKDLTEMWVFNIMKVYNIEIKDKWLKIILLYFSDVRESAMRKKWIKRGNDVRNPNPNTKP